MFSRSRQGGGGGGIFGGLWKPKNPHSLEHLKYLCSVLHKNQTVTDGNRSLLVETLRSIAEILIWGDQNDSSVFDFFLERNMLTFFLNILDQNPGSYVCVQLLQTLNILFENIRNETSIYYLLSNNHVNAIIVHKFDFSDEEVMAYYISFLKTLSFRLNKHTIHFFYNEHTNDFPLYTEAIKFFNHSESMVRVAVRTLTLNVYRVEEESMLKFVIDKTAVPYFSNLVWFIGNQILDIDTCVRGDADHRSLNRLKDLVAEHLDHLHFLNDILCLQIDALNAVLTDHLLNRLFIPLYIYSIGAPNHGVNVAQADEVSNSTSSTSKLQGMKPQIRQVTSLFLLCQVLLILTHEPLVKVLSWIILEGDADVFTAAGAAKISLYSQSRGHLSKPTFAAPSQPLDKSLRDHLMDSPSPMPKQPPRATGAKPKERGTRLAQETQHADAVESSAAVTALSITDEEKEKRLNLASSSAPTSPSKEEPNCAGAAVSAGADPREVEERRRRAFSVSDGSRPFLAAVFETMECAENDYLALFALCLIYSMQHNTGMTSSLLESVFIPGPKSNAKELYNITLVEKLLRILYASCQYGSKVRLVTLDIAIQLLKSLVLRPDGSSALQDNHFAEMEGVREESTLLLRNFYKSEEIFLDMFEDEHREATKRPTRLDYLMSDAALLLPPAATPLTGIDFAKRLPCGEVERARRAIRTFFRLRQLSLDVQGFQESRLPLSSPDTCIQVQDVLDLNNSDLLAVTVVSRDESRQRRFLVVGVYQIVLVEPDATRLGWGVATFVGFLQDVEVVTDKDDSRCLHVTVHSPARSSKTTPATSSSSSTPSRFGAAAAGVGRSGSQPFLSAIFTFDDHIRCMAAKQRLTKGRTKARQRKMHQIARLLELPGNVGPSCPSPPSLNLHSLRKEAAAQRRGRKTSGSGGPTPSSSSHPSSSSSSGYRSLFSSGAGTKVPGAATLLTTDVGSIEESGGGVRRISSGPLSATALKSTSMLGAAATRIPLSLAAPAAAAGIDADASPRRRLTNAADVTVDYAAGANALENDEDFFDKESSPPSDIPETETRL